MEIAPLEKFFSRDVSRNIRENYKITSMNQLVAIVDTTVALTGFAESIGLRHLDFMKIINKARKVIELPAHSKRKYPTGIAI